MRMRDTTLTSPEMHMESRSMFLYEISCLLGKYNWPKIFYLFYFIIIYFILLLLFYFTIIIILLLLLLFYFIDHLFSWVSSMFTIWTAR